MDLSSYKNRFLFKLITNLLSFFISLALAGIVPRVLGVESFGNFNFIIGILTQVLLMLEMRTSTCFYTKLSQNLNSTSIIVFYLRLAILIFLVFFIIVFFFLVTPLKITIFPNQENKFIYMGIFIVGLNWFLEILSNIMDAHGDTIKLEIIKIVNKILGVLVLLLIIYTSSLSLTKYFFYQYFISLSLIISITYFINRKLFKHPVHVSKDENFGKEFYNYCAPLFFYLLLGFSYQFFDRWALQYYGGSFQQGLYSFSFNIANICLLFTSPIIPLMMREMSISFGKNDILGMAKIFRNQSPVIYAITAFFCCYVFTNSERIILLFGGDQYILASPILSIIIFYPLFSIYALIHSSVIYSNGRTRLFLIMNIVFAPISIISSFIMLSRLNMGGAGIALKETILAFINGIIYLFVNTHFLKVKATNYLIHFIIIPIIFVFLALIVKFSIELFPAISSAHAIVYLSISGLIYFIITIIITLYFPVVLGLKKDYLKKIYINHNNF